MEASVKNIKATKTARYYQLGELSPTTKRIWIVLHGYGQLASYFIKHFEPYANAETCVLAPEALSRFYLDGKWERVGATWMTKEDRLNEVDDYVNYLDSLLDKTRGELGHTPEIVILGFSQGTATAWRWMMRGEMRVKNILLWAGSIPIDVIEKAKERLENCGLHFILGDKDPFIKISDAEKQLDIFRKMKPNAKLWTFEGDHRMDAPTLEKIIQSWDSENA